MSFLFCCHIVRAQEGYVISGIIKAKSGGVLPGAGVYVSGYKLGTAANDKGRFSLPPLRNGTYDLLVQMIGYLPASRQVTVSNNALDIEILLDENPTNLSEVVIRPDPDRLNHLRIFRESFIGMTENAENCRISNEDVLRTHFDPQTRVLTVNADEFLIIENKSLGYRIKYLLKEFEFDMRSKIVYYSGLPTYEDLPASPARMRRYIQKRLVAYNGSTQHFFRALYQGTTEQQGFLIHKLIPRRNPNRLPDSLIDANLARLRAARGPSNKVIITAGDSIGYWMRMKNEPEEIRILNRKPVRSDTLVRTLNGDLKFVPYADILYIVYTRERETDSFRARLGMSINRPPDMPNYQVSLVNLIKYPLYFYSNGEVADPRSVLFEGVWSWEKIADSLPMNYSPPADKR
ncbi:carboxypeptidase-like regulatory domain-containing protein [Pedobacter sp. SYP-B3415]|uniref:carboxypeptidase-like regulatory domain-containing protein n=1 Tax=Pedobacter sp. SYP-B3415 TaxID=2496641 RepID=UPI0013ED5B6D|nr:carboxypeptidase-like regulatory domain-containing protein [Pedobacter sp. SYP-B3415]